MADILDIATKLDTPLQILGLIIIAITIVIMCIIIYKTIQSIELCILKFRKVDVKIDKDDIHINTHLRQ